MKPKLVRTLAALRRETAKWRKEGLSYAVVPTMGAIHSGHMELVTEGLERADRVITTIFVNPTQFAVGEDFGEYPRTWDADLDRCEEAGVDVVFAPEVATMYPHGTDDQVMVDPGPLGGKARHDALDRDQPLLLVEEGADATCDLLSLLTELPSRADDKHLGS